MVETGTFATPDTTIAMAAFTMYGVGKTFAENTPLHGKILVVIEGRTFVGTPAHRAMVDNDVLMVTSPQSIIFRLFLVAHAAADKTDDNIIGLHSH